MVEALMNLGRRSYVEGYKQAIRDIGRAAEEKLGERGAGLKKTMDDLADDITITFNQ